METQSTSNFKSVNSPTPKPCLRRSENTGIAIPAPFQGYCGKSNFSSPTSITSGISPWGRCKILSSTFSQNAVVPSSFLIKYLYVTGNSDAAIFTSPLHSGKSGLPRETAFFSFQAPRLLALPETATLCPDFMRITLGLKHTTTVFAVSPALTDGDLNNCPCLSMALINAEECKA